MKQLSTEPTQAMALSHATFPVVKQQTPSLDLQELPGAFRHSTLLSKSTDTLYVERAHQFGSASDGVIEAMVHVRGKYPIEIGYYYGLDKPKSIVKISTQAGCAAQCSFCEVGREPLKANLSAQEMQDQVALMLQIAAGREVPIHSKRHKVNFAGTGDGLANSEVIEAIKHFGSLGLSVKLSTVFPKGQRALSIFKEVCELGGAFPESLQIQISLISTDEAYRRRCVGAIAASFEEIRVAIELWRAKNPFGRKVNMSLILSEDTPADPTLIQKIFPPALVRFRFRDYIPSAAGSNAGLLPITEKRYSEITESFRLAGYEVFYHARPTETERLHGLASNVTRRRELEDRGNG